MNDKARARQASRWLSAQARAVRGPLTAAIGGHAVAGILLIPQAFILARLIDAVAFGHRPAASELGLTGGLLVVFVARALAAVVGAAAADRTGLLVQGRVRRRLLAQVPALGPLWIAARQPGALANTLVDGVKALHAYYADYLPQAALSVIVPGAILAAVFPVDWISGLVFACTAALIPVFMVLLGQGAAAMNQRQWRGMARLSAHFFEVLAGLPVLQAFGVGHAEEKVVTKLSEDYRRSTMRVLRVAFLSSFALEFLSMLSIAMVAVLVGFRLFWGDIGFTAGLAVLLLAPEFYQPLRKLGDAYHARLAAVAAAEDIADIMAEPIATGRGRRGLRPDGAFTVVFEDVTYRYPGASRDALRSVTLRVAPQEHVALIGATGAGKSTLMNLLLGFMPVTAGQIIVAGQRLDELQPEAWRQTLAWVPQRAHLFAGSVADNIALGLHDCPRAAIVAAAERAQARAFIEALPQGFDALVGEGGAGLSGGEVQRIALARAFLRDAPLVILDEPTASLDVESESAVVAALEQLRRGRTMISIAHRLHTVRAADRVIVLEEGRVVDRYSPQQAVVRDTAGWAPPRGAS
ncbi:MAG TPA: thiol reductant ABC exporter subunit CydD [Nevskiaceae bacterium]